MDKNVQTAVKEEVFSIMKMKFQELQEFSPEKLQILVLVLVFNILL